jgi:hypothetical protein
MHVVDTQNVSLDWNGYDDNGVYGMGGREGVGGTHPPPTTHAGSCMRACGLPQLFMSVRLPQRTPKSLHYEESAWIKMGKGLDAICLLHTLLQDTGVIVLEFGKIRYYYTFP